MAMRLIGPPKPKAPDYSHPALSFVGKGGPTFLTLPLEIRRRIYENLLVCDYGGSIKARRYHRMGPVDRGMVFLVYGRRPVYGYKQLGVGILRTCQQAYREAIPVLYAQNMFVIQDPRDGLALLTQARSSSIRMILSVTIIPHLYADTAQWKAVLEHLARDASALRYLRVVWEATTVIRDGEGRSASNRFGTDVEFARALVQIQGLEKLAIEGYYGKNWPTFLERNMHVTVEVSSIYDRFFDVDLPETATEEELERWRWNGEMRQQMFAKYQEGTEDLWP